MAVSAKGERVLGEGVCPETKWVEGSNYVDIGFKLDQERTVLL